MLKHQYRFHGHSSLRFLYQQGKTERSRALAIRFTTNPRRADSRIAVVVTRKVLKSAPRRNRIRRRIYELLRTHWQQVAPGRDILITVFDPNLSNVSHSELESILFELLTHARLLQHEESHS